MISDVETAKEVSQLMLEASGALNEAMRVVHASDCADEEKKPLLLAIGRVIAGIGLDVLNNFYLAHPEIKPDEYYLPGVSKP
jgi:hypothetical protein